jgi:hypothetical protein
MQHFHMFKSVFCLFSPTTEYFFPAVELFSEKGRKISKRVGNTRESKFHKDPWRTLTEGGRVEFASGILDVILPFSSLKRRCHEKFLDYFMLQYKKRLKEQFQSKGVTYS